MTDILCGVDVSSEHLDACVGRVGPRLRASNTADGLTVLIAFCREHRVDLAVMEATGGYERLPFALLWEAGIACAIVNPRSVRRFAEAMGFLEKTDRIDAGVIGWYGVVKQVAATLPASADQQQLRALTGRLRQLTALKTSQTNQRRLLEEPLALASIDEIVALVGRQIRDLSARIAELVAADPLWAELDRAFREIKGVADRTVATLIADLPEIGTFANKAASKLVGVAPLARDSGKLTGKRSVRGGRASLRSILFVVAELVRRHDPDFAAFHKRLSDAGKPKKVIRVALAHKLLVRLNAKARDVRAKLAIAA